jgi:hypothetical protein
VADPAAALARRSRTVWDHPDSRHPRQVWRHSHPVVADDGEHRRRTRNPRCDDRRDRDRARADFLGRPARAINGLHAVRPTPALKTRLGDETGFHLWIFPAPLPVF